MDQPEQADRTKPTEAYSENPLAAAQTLVEKWQRGEVALGPLDGPHRDDLAQQGAERQLLLREWNAAPSLEAAGLLLPWLLDTPDLLAHVASVCGPRTGALCQEYIETLQQMPENRWRGQESVLLRIKYFMLAYRDADLVFLGVADLWCRFQRARSAARTEQRAYVSEGEQVLGPLLEFLGMNACKEALDDWLCMCEEAAAAAPPQLQDENKHMAHELEERLAPRMPNATFTHRTGTQIHNAFLSTDPFHHPAPPQRTPHVLNMLIIVDSHEACYRALAQLHTLYIPIEGSFADFTKQSRLNGYRALHTAVVATLHSKSPAPDKGPDKEQQTQGQQGKKQQGQKAEKQTKVRMRVNFTICTAEMDEINRWGLAALHLRQRLSVQLPHAWWRNSAVKYRQIASAPLGSLPETLYVFSPHGELFRFHRGCTVVDYAYHVHSELASHCRRFYVNGETVEPATVLHHLDLVELEYDSHAPGPTRVWLNSARTARARSRIDKFLKRQGQGAYHGQKTLDARLKILEDHYGFNIPEHRLKSALVAEMRRRKLTSTEELMDEVAAGRLAADKILHPLFAEEIIRQVQIPREMRLRPHQLHLSQCCRPRPGDDIVGLPYYRDGLLTRLRIHRVDCDRLAGVEGTVPLRWRLQPALKTVAQLEIRALDEAGLLGDALAQIYGWLPRVILHRSEAVARNGMASVRFVIEAESDEVIQEIADAMRRLPNRNIDEVRTMRLPLSERDELVRPVSSSSLNPYTRLPVQKQGMFFGRSKELYDLCEWLRADVGVIWLLGQKRVGKTSLLLHLKNEFLDRREFLPVFVDFQLLGSLETTSVFFEVANAVYSELQGHGRVDELGAPLRDMFEHDPPGHLRTYLRSVQSHPDVGRLVLLLDEFSRTTDAYGQGLVEEGLFQQWRGLINAVAPDTQFVIVVQQQAVDGMLQRVQEGHFDPSWHLMELGERLALKPLADKDARHLIEWPMRNYLEFADAELNYVYELTGGSPFLIQAFCFKLVGHMVRQNKRQVEMEDIETVSMEFMSPNESVFAHLLDLIRGVGNSICVEIAHTAEETGTCHVTWAHLRARFPKIPPPRLRRTLRELCERDILYATKSATEPATEPAAGSESDTTLDTDSESWRFACLLFQRWLAFNSG